MRKSKKLPKDSGVYIITNNINNFYYIGSSTYSVKDRLKQHINSLRINKHHNILLQKAFNKYGENAFSFEELETHLPEYCVSMEQFWINLLQTANIKHEYNICSKALNSLGTRRTKEQCLNISNSLKGKYIGEKNPNYGVKCSIEKLEKIKENMSTAKKVVKLTKDNKIIAEFRSLKEAAKSINGDPGHISNTCNGKYTSSYGFNWKYKDVKPKLTPKTHNIEVHKYSLKGEYIQSYNSIKEASKDNNCYLKGLIKDKPVKIGSFLWSKNKLNNI